ncbi:MAG TPA: DNA gyrase inhibitor YacG [Sphingomicrobium sp.]
MPKQPDRPKACPICGKPEVKEHAPFCSRGCKDRDLLKWLGEGYRIPGPPADERHPPDRVDSDRDES